MLPGSLLAGKVAVVTGAGRGIGKQVARLFASQGARVVVHFHTSRDAAEHLAREIGGWAVKANLADPGEAAEMIAQAHARYGQLDILINNAASFAHDLTMESAEWDDFRTEFDGVVGTTVNPTRAVVPLMKAQGGGRIVNLVATLVQRPAAEFIVHTTAKSALIGYSRTLAKELGPHNITVNMVSPGLTLTDFSSALPQSVKDSVARQTPLRRLATADDVARAALFFASPLADFVTAANLAPDGGLSML